MILFFSFIFSLFSTLKSDEFCKINNILEFSELNCTNGQLTFGFLNFYSNQNQLEYEYISELDIKVVKKYRKQILFYINNNCNRNQKIKIKEIINLELDKMQNYKIEIIIV